jgi:hypothetical protein
MEMGLPENEEVAEEGGLATISSPRISKEFPGILRNPKSILPNFDLFVFQIFVAQQNIVCTLKWPSLTAKKRKKIFVIQRKKFGRIDSRS